VFESFGRKAFDELQLVDAAVAMEFKPFHGATSLSYEEAKVRFREDCWEEVGDRLIFRELFERSMNSGEVNGKSK
jgi:hypothetical protein